MHNNEGNISIRAVEIVHHLTISLSERRKKNYGKLGKTVEKH